MAAASAALELDAKGQALLCEAQHVVARDGTPCPGLQQAAVDALINVVGNRQFAQMVADATGESLTLRARARLGKRGTGVVRPAFSLSPKCPHSL